MPPRDEHDRRASAAHEPSWTRTAGAAVAMMQWRLRRGKRAREWESERGVEWVPRTVQVKPPPPTVSSGHPPRRRRRRRQGRTAGAETSAGRFPNHPVPPARHMHAHTRPGVSVSPAASHVMTVGSVSHTSVRRSSQTGAAPTPCSPSRVGFLWGGLVYFAFSFQPPPLQKKSKTFVLLPAHLRLSGPASAVRTGAPWLREPPAVCWRWCWSPRRLSVWPCRWRSGRSWRSWSWSSPKVSWLVKPARPWLRLLLFTFCGCFI